MNKSKIGFVFCLFMTIFALFALFTGLSNEESLTPNVVPIGLLIMIPGGLLFMILTIYHFGAFNEKPTEKEIELTGDNSQHGTQGKGALDFALTYMDASSKDGWITVSTITPQSFDATSFVNSKLPLAEQAIINHLNKVVAAYGVNDRAKQHLRSIQQKMMPTVLSVIQEKLPLSLNDGLNHSMMFGQEVGLPLVSVSCWPCRLRNLNEHVSREIGDYLALVISNVHRAQVKGFCAFIHLFICCDKTGIDITLTHVDVEPGHKHNAIFPEELEGHLPAGDWGLT